MKSIWKQEISGFNDKLDPTAKTANITSNRGVSTNSSGITGISSIGYYCRSYCCSHGLTGPIDSTDIISVLSLVILSDKEILDNILRNINNGPSLVKKHYSTYISKLTDEIFYTFKKRKPEIIGKKHIPKQIIKGKYFDIVLNAIRQVDPEYTEEELIREKRIGGYIVDDIKQEYYENKYSTDIIYDLEFLIVSDNICTREKIFEIMNSYNKN